MRPPPDDGDHQHCEFCGSKLSMLAGDLRDGHATADSSRWICADCFADFRDEYGWDAADGLDDRR